MTPQQKHAVACSDSWLSLLGLATYTELLEALKEVERVLTSPNPAIVDTVWVSNGLPETLLDHVRAALEKATGSQS